MIAHVAVPLHAAPNGTLERMNLTQHCKRWIVLVPNALSLLRLVLSGFFPIAEGYWRAGIIVAVAVSDGADGFIARRCNAATWIGGLLDAFADKVFVLIVLGTYLAGGELALWEAALLLSRDLVVFGVVGYAAGLRLWGAFKRMPARLLGKLTTAALLGLLLLIALAEPPRGRFVEGVLFAAMVLSLAAALDYFLLFLRGEWARRAGRLADVASGQAED